MRKLIFATTLLFSTVAYVACTTDNMKPTQIAIMLSDKANFGSGDVSDDTNGIAPQGDDRANLGQADYSGNGSGH